MRIWPKSKEEENAYTEELEQEGIPFRKMGLLKRHIYVPEEFQERAASLVNERKRRMYAPRSQPQERQEGGP